VTPSNATLTGFVVTHVRQALQQTVAIGACSPYLVATSPMRPEAISFMPTSYAGFLLLQTGGEGFRPPHRRAWVSGAGPAGPVVL
jgi:hypothetical protein